MSKPKHPGFLVWNPQGHHPRYRHHSLETAAAEAKRLAAQNPGFAFYVLVPVSAAHVTRPDPILQTIDPYGPVDTQGWLDEEIPF